MNWVVVVRNDDPLMEERHVVIGPFREESTADGWAERVNDGYEGVTAWVEWAYSPRPKDALGEALSYLTSEESRV